MPVFHLPRLKVLAIIGFCCTAAAKGGDFQWNPAANSDWQWTNPLNWLSDLGGAPSATDIAVFTHLTQPAESPITRGDPDPTNLPPIAHVLPIGGIRATGYYSYDLGGNGLDDWRLELSRFAHDENNQIVSNAFTLDLDGGNGSVNIGHFVEPATYGDPALAIPGGLTITGRTTIDNVTHSAAAGFRGVVDVRHGRLTIQDINYDDHDTLSTIGGLVDTRDDLSYIPQRLPTAVLAIDHSHFDSFKTRGLAIGTVGKASAEITNNSVLSNLKFLRIGGDSSQVIGSHELSSLTVVDSALTVGAATDGGIFVGDMSAPDLIDPYNGTLTLTRSSIAPSVIRDGNNAIVGYEPLDVRVGHFGIGKATLQDSSSVTARRLFVGEKRFSFGELRINSSQLNLQAPAGGETPDHAGRFSVGAGGLGFVVVTGSSSASSSVSVRSMSLGESQNAYGDVYFDRNSDFTIEDSGAIGVGGQGRLTVTGRFDSENQTLGRNVYFASTATIGTRPSPLSSDPTRTYTLNVGKVWASAGFLLVGEGARLSVTDQPITGADDVDEGGTELWRTTDHRLVIGDDGLGWMTVHADGLARAERLIVGQTTLGVGHVLLDKAFLNPSAANTDYAVPGTLSVSRTAVIGVNGLGTLDIRGPYVRQVGDTFDQYGMLAASLTLGDQHGSSGSAHLSLGGQLVVNGTLSGERDLIIARDGVGILDVGDALVLSGSGSPPDYVSGGTGGTVRVTNGLLQIGGADEVLHVAAKGTVTINPNSLLDVQMIQLGSDVSSGDSLSVRGGATALVNGSELRTFAGGTVRASHIDVRGQSTLAIETTPNASLDPLLDGSVHVSGGLDVYDGTLRLGTVERTASGAMSADVTLHGGQLTGMGTVDGSLLADGGNVSIQIRGATRFSEYDSFQVNDVATFTSGGIVVEAGSFIGQIGQKFDVFTFTTGSRSTSFDVTNPLAAQPGAQWVSYLDSDSYTLAVAGATGDANLDGAVDFDDLLIIAQHYEESGIQNWITGDFNDDATVNFDDLLFVAQNYGSHLLGEATLWGDGRGLSDSFASDWAMAMSIAPEPGAALTLSAMVAVGRRRRGH